jgi:N6-adenosine-specific RNA methylase IME4
MSWPFHPLQRGTYSVISADPPYFFSMRSSKGYAKSPSQHYSLMTLDNIKTLPVVELAAPDCCLCLWTTQAQLHQGLAVMESWGFEFKTAGTWAKQSPTGASWAFGTGYILRSAAEFFLIGTRGRPKIESHSERNLIVAPVREHSRKQDESYAMLERLFPNAKRCELFARSTRPEWDSWGDEVGQFDDAGLEVPPRASREPVRQIEINTDHVTAEKSVLENPPLRRQ